VQRAWGIGLRAESRAHRAENIEFGSRKGEVGEKRRWEGEKLGEGGVSDED
jgi:hypothetical protein